MGKQPCEKLPSENFCRIDDLPTPLSPNMTSFVEMKSLVSSSWISLAPWFDCSYRDDLPFEIGVALPVEAFTCEKEIS